MPDELTPTPASEWPKNVAVTVTLPSGGVAKLKAPDTFALMRSGKVPKKITAILGKRSAKRPIVEAEAIALIEYLICMSFVEPEVSFVRKAGTVHFSEISDADKTFVMTLMELV